jgi:8-oxo-dGTP diphosphatase
MEIPECFYRVSVKALVLNDTRDKFLICEEENGVWDLPGGGLDFGATPEEDLAREIQEEMGLTIMKMADQPSYFVTEIHVKKQLWKANVVYEAELEHLNFIPSEECVAIRFVDKHDVTALETFPGVKQIAEQFSPENHPGL